MLALFAAAILCPSARAAGGGAVRGWPPPDAIPEPKAVACAEPELLLKAGRYDSPRYYCSWIVADLGSRMYLSMYPTTDCQEPDVELACEKRPGQPRTCRGSGERASWELAAGDQGFVLRTKADGPLKVYVFTPKPL